MQNKNKNKKSGSSKIAPLLAAVLPGGLGLAISLHAVQRQAAIGAEIDAMVARADLVDTINSIDCGSWIESSLSSMEEAMAARSEFVAANPGVDIESEAAAEVFRETYDAAMVEATGIPEEYFPAINQIIEDKAEVFNADYEGFMESYWQSMGFSGSADANALLRPITDAALNGNDAAFNFLTNITYDVCDEFIYDPIHGDASQIASDLIQAQSQNGGFMGDVMTALSANPELGVVVALGAAGAGALGYCAYNAVAGKSKSADVEQTR